MWISGRRAFRPDSQYYRRTRRLGRPRQLRSGGATWLGAAVLMLVILITWWAFR
jgi:hypothetical protein